MTEHLVNQLYNIVRLFYPNAVTTVSDDTVVFGNCEKAAVECKLTGKGMTCTVGKKVYEYRVQKQSSDKRLEARLIANNLYQSLCQYTGRSMPWGSLTGIRPTMLARQHNDVNELADKYHVSLNKIELLERIIETQQKHITRDPKNIAYYVNIPICPSKCIYCSFVSGTAERYGKLIDKYVSVLCGEIERDMQSLEAHGYSIHSVYVGGGTPTVLSVKNLARLMSVLPKAKEVTVEAGRPDTVDEAKLNTVAKHGATRISINPQSFRDGTLKVIGRNHTAEDTIRAYRSARSYNLSINMDLIAGLPGEALSDFEYSLDKTIDLAPHNITVHTLSQKRGSALYGGRLTDNNPASMVDTAYGRLIARGYAPYYLYRQKSQLGALENVGYARAGYECIFNITAMEETVSVLAAGAGGITKRVGTGEGNPITRYANAKDIELYLAQFEDRYQAKVKSFFMS